MLVKGVWQQTNPPNVKGGFKRPSAPFRQWPELSAIEKNPKRYILFVSKACPWAHRTLIMIHLKGLSYVIDVLEVKPYMAEHGWVLKQPLRAINATYLHQLYTHTDPQYTGKVTVPLLWDKVENRIVNNESADIIEMLNDDWNAHAKSPLLDLMPEHLRIQREEKNQWIYEHINNAVYRTGFASEQRVYEKECQQLFAALDQLEQSLVGQYLFGDQLYDSDIRLFTTLIRFDAVYAGHFKCNLKLIREYTALYPYMVRIYNQVKDTVDMKEIKAHYYQSHPWINPNQIIALSTDRCIKGE
ncbi:glutathione S-transferase C-terminal domain-containing protein [Gammaproteobacteria bacterium]|nr:glutathione S-transferase C-terminal domain-containing protein [Gammaproteobacteria bacterium]